ncbi:MAG: PAS domain-containing protein [Treponema sp.]|jgi:two-component system phosphate regulon sensor histidine kinase PhoR|nr:PAS domain-containing protein [Treponema sp.]
MKSFFYKNLLALALAAGAAALSLTLSLLFFADSGYYETNTRALLETAQAMAFSMPDGFPRRFFEDEAGPAESLPAESWVQALPGASPFRITLIRRDGTVLADSRLDAADAVNHADRPEVRAALSGVPGSSRRNSRSVGVKLIYAALPVYGADGQVIGAFRLSHTTPGFWRRLSPKALPFLGCGLLVMLAIFAALYGFSRALSKPLDELAALARSLRDPGNADWAAPPGGPLQSAAYGVREFDLLDRALRSMAMELRSRIAEARAEGRRLEAILNGMNEAVLALDGNLGLCLANPKARELFAGAGTPDLPRSLLEAGCPVELEDAAKAVLAGGRALERELRLPIGGNSRCFRLFAAPLDRNGGGVVMVLGDLTRLHQLERVRQDFAANVSHELRTPIQLIKGYAEALLEASPLAPPLAPPSAPPAAASGEGEPLRRGIEIIWKSALTMENLTTDLLSLVSLEDESRARPEPQEAGVKDLLDEALGFVEPAAAKKRIRITARCGAELRASVHGTLLAQALINMLDNAVKYSPPSSEVRVEAFAVSGERPEMVIAVKDQGPGIPAEHQSRIFERFYRVDKARSREQGGTGLGLAIVRHIALLHGGTVEVESRAGEGSVFRLRIPV